MTARMILAAGALLASGSAWAQTAPGAEQTTEDLVCQLSEKCADEASSPADVAAPAATTDKAAPRVSATRGFKIARKTEAGASAPASTGYTAARPVAGKPQARVDYGSSGKKATVVLYGPPNLFEGIKPESMKVDIERNNDGVDAPNLILPDSLKGSVEIRSVKVRQ